MRIEIKDGYVQGFVNYHGYGESQVIGIYTDGGVLRIGSSTFLPVKHKQAKLILECMNAAFAKAEEMVNGSKESDEETKFILELTELTRKYGISIGGCGCCGSPWLDHNEDITDERSGYAMSSEGLKWVAPSDTYDWEHYADGIIRAII